MNKYIYIVLLFCLLASCNSRENKQTEATVIAFDKIAKGSFEIGHPEYTLLETTEQSLLGGISKVIYKNDKYYILDKIQNNGVYMFDKNGKYLSSINKQGDGPGEYLEIADMDVDNENNLYIADNGKMNILKYKQADPSQYETIHVGEHFLEFCCINEHTFLLRDLFGEKGQKAKLAYFDCKKKSITPLLTSKNKDINEMAIMNCSKHYLYRSDDQLFYNDRFTPHIYSIRKDGTLAEAYTIASEHYIPDKELKGLEKNPMKFIQETNYIKDLVCLYETDDSFICMPFITPSATYLFIPKANPQNARKIDFTDKPELQGTTQIEAVVNNRFVVLMNYSEEQAERLKDNPALQGWNEESNPVLCSFTIE